jgi:hypothetical protein
MLIAIDSLNEKIIETIKRLKDSDLIGIKTANDIAVLEDSLNLVRETAANFNIDEFPTSEKDCQALIRKDNDLTEYDIDGLRHLANNVKWVLDTASKNKSS